MKQLNKTLSLSLFCFVMFFMTNCYANENKIYIIKLNYVDANDVIELIKPHLNKHDTITGKNNQLFITTNKAKYGQIHSLVKQYDSMPKQLIFSMILGATVDELENIFGIQGPFNVGENIYAKEDITSDVYTSNLQLKKSQTYQIRLQENFPITLNNVLAKRIVTSQFVNNAFASRNFSNENKYGNTKIKNYNLASKRKSIDAKQNKSVLKKVNANSFSKTEINHTNISNKEHENTHAYSNSRAYTYDYLQTVQGFQLRARMINNAQIEIELWPRSANIHNNDITSSDVVTKIIIKPNRWLVLDTINEPINENNNVIVYRLNNTSEDNKSRITLIKISVIKN